MAVDNPLNYTVQERVLLHILAHNHRSSDVVLPEAVTQQGIATAVNVGRKHVPRTVRQMMEKGLLEERTAHVKGKSQRMKTYSLTEEGERAARRLSAHLDDTIVLVRTKSGITERPVKGVEGFSQAEVVSYLSNDGIFDADEVRRSREREAENDALDKRGVYSVALAQAWKDGKLTQDEKDILGVLRERLGIGEREHRAMEKEVLASHQQPPNDSVIEVYKVALQQALEDGTITEDEQAILDKIKKRFNIDGGE